MSTAAQKALHTQWYFTFNTCGQILDAREGRFGGFNIVSAVYGGYNPATLIDYDSCDDTYVHVRLSMTMYLCACSGWSVSLALTMYLCACSGWSVSLASARALAGLRVLWLVLWRNVANAIKSGPVPKSFSTAV